MVGALRGSIPTVPEGGAGEGEGEGPLYGSMAPSEPRAADSAMSAIISLNELMGHSGCAVPHITAYQLANN